VCQGFRLNEAKKIESHLTTFEASNICMAAVAGARIFVIAGWAM